VFFHSGDAWEAVGKGIAFVTLGGLAFSEHEVFMTMAAIGLLLLGIYILCEPLRAFRTLVRTAYAITDKRVLVIVREAKGALDVCSFEGADLSPIECSTYSDGTTDIRFAHRLCIVPRNRSSHRVHAQPVELVRIRSAEGAERALRALQKG
jgi:hypothetical protein